LTGQVKVLVSDLAVAPAKSPGSALLGFVNDDAAWLADRIAVRVRHGHLAGPGSVPSLRC
jgi:hypothetical protein